MIAVLPAIVLFVVLQRFIVGTFVQRRAEGLRGVRREPAAHRRVGRLRRRAR